MTTAPLSSITPDTAPRPRIPYGLTPAVFVASFSAVFLQVSLMRLVSVIFQPMLVFAMIGVALLGYGAAGSFLAAYGNPAASETPRYFGWRLVVCGAVALPVFLVVNAIDMPSAALFGTAAGWPVVLAIYAALSLPFLFAGLGMSAAFAAFPGEVNRLYFADLVGAGMGSAAAVAVIPWLGGPALVATAGVAAAVAGGLAFRAAGVRATPAVVVAGVNLALAVVLAVWHPIDARISSDKHGAILSRSAKRGGLRVDFSRWSRFGRVDITEPFSTLPPQFGGDISTTFKDLRIEQRMLMLDGAAPAFLYRLDGPPSELRFLSGTSQSVGYRLRPAPRVLVIGVGGGTDVLIALHHGATAVTAVELNPVNAYAVQTHFADYVGHLLSDPRVSLVVAEGRNFAARDHEHYDLVQLSGVDTGAAQGAYGLGTMPESYIYTVEAFEDLLERLAPGGILTITRDSRFGWSARVTALAREALRRKGIDPAPCIAVLEGKVYGWATILVKREPFTSAEIDTIAEFSTRHEFPFADRPDVRGDGVYDQVVRDDLPFRNLLDLRPSTDDWPFLFVSGRWSKLLDVLRLQDNPLANPLIVLMVNALGLTVVAVLMIGWPLWRLRHAWRTTTGKATALGYFALLGAAYILIEVALMQRFTVFLGNPALAVATVLAALLVGSGLGSATARQWTERGRDVVLVAVAWIVIVQLLLAASPVREAFRHLLWLPLPARLALVVAVVGIAGFPMGMPFPFGLARVAGRAPGFVPWGWGINGMVSVVFSLLSYLFGMIFGYTAMLYTGACLYLGAFALSRRL